MSEKEKSVNISAQITPNPDTLKFVLDKTLIEGGSINFLTKEDAATSPLINAFWTGEGPLYFGSKDGWRFIAPYFEELSINSGIIFP